MQLFKRLKFFILTAAVISLLSLSSFAATPAPDPTANPVLANIAKLGAKFYYLGAHAGLDGWFIVKDGKVQIAYSTPDKQGIIIGALFGADGDNITVNQIKTLVQNNSEISSLLMSAAQDQAGVGAATPPQSAKGNADILPSVAVSPGERLMQELSSAFGVTVGSGKPRLYMIMDPNCPHCQATWKALRSEVMSGALQIRMIPIGNMATDNERAAAQFLHTADPLGAWDKYVNGDKSQLAGKPDEALIANVRANHLIVDNWNISVTPYMVYRGKDGKVKIVQGELDKPEKVTTLLADLGS